jgi:hypothetical protein
LGVLFCVPFCVVVVSAVRFMSVTVMKFFLRCGWDVGEGMESLGPWLIGEDPRMWLEEKVCLMTMFELEYFDLNA